MKISREQLDAMKVKCAEIRTRHGVFFDPGGFDQAIHDHFSQRASSVNNEGFHDQLLTLMEEGWSEEEILKAYETGVEENEG